MNLQESFDLLEEDRNIKFDKANVWKYLRNGEMRIALFPQIEDSKGNIGEAGWLVATNLRIIWYLENKKKSNLSIGYNCISNINTRIVPGRCQGFTNNALYVMAVESGTRFEFLFTDISENLERKNSQIFQEILEIHRSYEKSYLYRDLRLRGAILLAGQLMLLPREQIVNSVKGVWNLSSDQGNLGCFVVTNIRIVWYADSNDIFNISLPYIQIENIHVRDSKYGPALVIKTAETGGSYVLGFRIDPIERLQTTYREFLILHRVYTDNPDFGVDVQAFIDRRSNYASLNKENMQQMPSDVIKSEIDEIQEIEVNSKLNSYLAAGSWSSSSDKYTKTPRNPIYCKALGFAIESIRDGYKLQDLWDVLPSNWIIIETEDE